MAQNPAIELLLKEKKKLTTERDNMFAKLSLEIVEIDTAIERLSGKRVWEVETEYVYDDTNPDYIKGSLEEI